MADGEERCEWAAGFGNAVSMGEGLFEEDRDYLKCACMHRAQGRHGGIASSPAQECDLLLRRTSSSRAALELFTTVMNAS